MNCPHCGASVVSEHPKCTSCGYDLTISKAVDELRSAIRLARADSEGVTRRTMDLEDRLAALEPLLLTGVETPPTAPPVVILDEDDAPPIPPPVVESRLDSVVADTSSERDDAPTPAAKPKYRPRDVAVAMSNASELQFGQFWLLIVGIVITVLAVGYFLKYSFDRNWIGPAGRVGLAYAAGFATWVTGELLRRRGFRVFGLYLIGGSIAVLYFAGYAAFQIYDLIGQPVAFGSMVVVTFFAGLMSVFYDTKWLAVLGIIGGFVTPVVLSTGVDNQVALMSYMLILNGGILAIAAFKQWQLLNYLGLSATWMLFTAWHFEHYADSKFWTTTIFLNAFFLTYALVPFAYYFLRSSPVRVVGFAITIPNAFIAFAYSYAMIERHFSTEAVAVATLSYAAVFFMMAAFLRLKRRDSLDAFVLLLAMGLMFLFVTGPIYFSKHWVTVFWLVEGIVVLWAAIRLADGRLRAGAVIVMLLATVKLVALDYVMIFGLDTIEFAFRDGFKHLLIERWVTAGVATTVLFVAARMLKRAGFVSRDWTENLTGLFYLLFGIVLFIALNIEVAGYFYEAAPRGRFASISVLWAIYASTLMVLGFSKSLSVLRRIAIALFGATVLKVFIRDMVNVETPFRILSFLVVGLLLVAASYLYHRFAARILGGVEEEVAEG